MRRTVAGSKPDPVCHDLTSARISSEMSLKKMKARAPPPPGKPTSHNVHSDQKLPHDSTLGSQHSLVQMKESLQNSTLDITVVLPSGLEKQSVVSGSHAMMDLLVDLCLQNHLNPSHHVLEIWSSETQQPLNFKPNTLIGSLNVHTVLLKEKVPEEKVKSGQPKVPEKSVRLVVNYLRTQKAVVRVSPEVPLQNILPVICAKCDVNPDHVVLLRDNVAGEELELSKSLNELGIKELYAWDNRRVLLTKTQSEPSLSYQEMFRKSSLGNDETDKEKKKFLGFFKVNKRSGSKGSITTPNSPSMHSRSLTLGPSLSLGNISGVSMKSEMKKRRAPPPPSPGLLGQDKASEKTSLSSQADLQKKKRRAPAPPPPQPPPPSPVVPNRMEDKEENRKSTVGVGRQVPQKPPRGTARGPPQLVLPPPPSYPPPDTDVTEPVTFPGEGTGSETSELRPKLSLPLGPGSHCSIGGASQVLPEAEETASVGSCFASEDTTEDSGVMSSPSDVISLDSQQDSVRSKDKWSTDQEDCSDQDLAGTPELGPQKSPSWGKNGSGNSILRNERVTMPPNDDEDLFITGHFHQTLAELDKDLEGMEDNYETDTSFLTSSTNGMSNHSLQEAAIPDNGMDDIPVTFIGEVPDEPVDSALFASRSNSAAAFNREDMANHRSRLSPFQTEHNQPYVRTTTKEPDPSPPSQEIRKRNQSSAFANTSEDENPVEKDPRVTSYVSKLCIDGLKAKDKGKVNGSTQSEKTQAGHRVNSLPVNQKDGDHESSTSALPPWSHHGQTSGGSYGLRHGLTTYKIVPPKSEMRCYDRDVSLSTGAIKIDELGNLVSPHMNGSRTVSHSSTVVETDAQPIGKVKEFWRLNSVEKCLNGPAECTAKRPPSITTTATPAKPQQDNVLKAAFTLPTPQQQPAPEEHGAHLEEESSRPRPAGSCHVKVPAAHPAEVTFLKPQRRTSSQYVASAIAKKMGPPKVHADVVRPHKKTAEKGHEEPKPVRPPPTGKDRDAPNLCSEARQLEHGSDQGSVCLSSNAGVQMPAGDRPRVEVSSSYAKSSTQDCPAAVHRNSNFLPVRSSQRDRVSVGPSCGFDGKQTTSNRKTSLPSNPTQAPERTPPPSLLLAEARNSGRILMNGSARASGNCEPPHGPKESSPTSYIILQTEEKPSPLTTDVQDTEDAPSSSIFGPKKKFKPVVQRPVPKDTSLHSALMEAIHSSGGRDKLRKTAEHTSEGRPKKLSYMETESERSALLAAIRGHSGTLSLRKVSSLASEELQSFRDAALLAPGLDKAQQEDHGPPPPPVLPPPPSAASQSPSASVTVSRFSTGTLSNTVDARQALMDAIRSGTGAARLRKVPLLV
ncbi:protein cordon-bleu isoform X4 [Chionomys nivalis]|uniref:protein cordon-bleu isoform X4 n=1 Tax=Chionomys nivalis TaxID=269649 RepID=UPI0025935E70|nr:protein cordon-bleu isoform X4 [Chionomys nivalis]